MRTAQASVVQRLDRGAPIVPGAAPPLQNSPTAKVSHE